MLFFKTIPFPDHIKQPQVEDLLRKSSLKRTLPLDFKSSVMDTGADKNFLGFEGKKSLEFTRFKTSLEFMLPKLIINIPKDQFATAYKIRLSAVPFALFLFLCFGFISIIIGLIRGVINAESTIVVGTLAILFFSLLALELKITKSRMLKTILKD